MIDGAIVHRTPTTIIMHVTFWGFRPKSSMYFLQVIGCAMHNRTPVLHYHFLWVIGAQARAKHCRRAWYYCTNSYQASEAMRYHVHSRKVTRADAMHTKKNEIHYVYWQLNEANWGRGSKAARSNCGCAPEWWSPPAELFYVALYTSRTIINFFFSNQLHSSKIISSLSA